MALLDSMPDCAALIVRIACGMLLAATAVLSASCGEMPDRAGGSGTVTPTTAITSSFTTTAPVFSDVPASNRFATAIYDPTVRSTIGGFDDGTFRPGALVTRQQFVVILVTALRLPVSTTDINSFTDVAPSEGDGLSPDHYLAVATASGIVKGYNSGNFEPDDYITRAHAIVLVVNALEKLYPGVLGSVPVSWSMPGSWGQLTGEQLDAAEIALGNSLMNGLDCWGVAKDPRTGMPRGEVAQVLHNMMRLLDVERTFHWSEEGEFGAARVTVQAPVADPGGSVDKPESGFRFVAAHIKVENVGPASIYLNACDFSLRDTSGLVYNGLEFGSYLDDVLTFGKMVPGQKEQGWRVFEIRENAVVDSVLYRPSFCEVALLVWR